MTEYYGEHAEVARTLAERGAGATSDSGAPEPAGESEGVSAFRRAFAQATGIETQTPKPKLTETETWAKLATEAAARLADRRAQETEEAQAEEYDDLDADAAVEIISAQLAAGEDPEDAFDRLIAAVDDPSDDRFTSMLQEWFEEDPASAQRYYAETVQHFQERAAWEHQQQVEQQLAEQQAAGAEFQRRVDAALDRVPPELQERYAERVTQFVAAHQQNDPAGFAQRLNDNPESIRLMFEYARNEEGAARQRVFKDMFLDEIRYRSCPEDNPELFAQKAEAPPVPLAVPPPAHETAEGIRSALQGMIDAEQAEIERRGRESAEREEWHRTQEDRDAEARKQIHERRERIDWSTSLD
ncbi:MAG: hypothetical protein ICV64_00525 [Thermoleophilia bacterium]|nr:hypothetical protein [Thermoleophilia bacterium]